MIPSAPAPPKPKMPNSSSVTVEDIQAPAPPPIDPTGAPYHHLLSYFIITVVV